MARRITNPYIICTNRILNSQKGIFCDNCKKWVHLQCTTLSISGYIYLSDSSNWYCSKCLEQEHPFNNFDDLEFKNIIFSLNTGTRVNVTILKKNSDQLKITNLINSRGKLILLNTSIVSDLILQTRIT